MQIEQILKDCKNKVSKFYGERLSKMILYGSWARGEANEGSDIDLLIVLKGRVNNEIERILSKKVYDIQLEYNTDISMITVSENQYRKNNMPVYLNVRNEGIEVSGSFSKFTQEKLRESYIKRKQKTNRKPFYKNFRPMKYKEEIIKLIEKSKSDFQAAELLFNGKKYEKSVSCCYYSMFYSAQAAILTKNIEPFHFQHKTIVSKFGELFAKTEILPKEMGTIFREAKDKRENADYNYNMLMSKEFADDVIEKGRKFNQSIENYVQKEIKKKQKKIRT